MTSLKLQVTLYIRISAAFDMHKHIACCAFPLKLVNPILPDHDLQSRHIYAGQI